MAVMADAPPKGLDLDKLFRKSSVFESSKSLQKADFKILRDKLDKVFVFTRKDARGYLFKKYMESDARSYAEQLQHYQERVNGARLMKEHIDANQITRITVPRKWLCELPSRFDTKKGPSYIVVVDYFSILDAEESEDEYKHIGRQQLAELCSILFTFRGLDFTARNAPYASDGRIVWIDTEHVKPIKPKIRSREKSYTKNIDKMLSGKSLRLAEDLLDELVRRSGLDKKRKRRGES